MGQPIGHISRVLNRLRELPCPREKEGMTIPTGFHNEIGFGMTESMKNEGD